MKRVLYLGSDPAFCLQDGRVIHYPVIRIEPRSMESPDIQQAFQIFSQFTHIVFTSKNTVKIFFDLLTHYQKSQQDLSGKRLLAIGGVTAHVLREKGAAPFAVAKEETQEGLIQILDAIALKNSYFFLPRSSLSRPVLSDYFERRKIRCRVCDVYDTHPQKLEPAPDLNQIDQIIFTSPSTVDAFFRIYDSIPPQVECIVQGPITHRALQTRLSI